MHKGGYIITNKPHGTLSIGVTNDLFQRMDEHRRKVGSKFAAKYNLTHLIYLYFEEFSDIRDAIAREKQLKRWRREKMVWLIERENPHWYNLCAEWFDEL